MLDVRCEVVPAPAPATSGWRRLGLDGPAEAARLALATVWLLDAVLQLQPGMAGRGAGGLASMMVTAVHGNPPWIVHGVVWTAALAAQHAALANTLVVVVQGAIAFGIASRRWVRPALAVSMVWALIVWWAGEGLGGVLAGVGPLAGAPGPALWYGVLAVLLWPSANRKSDSVAVGGLGPRSARAVWVGVWALMAVLAVADGGGALVAIGCVLIGASVLGSVTVRRAGVVAAAVGAMLAWILVQHLGGILLGGATDPSSGPLVALFALCYWPAPASSASVEGEVRRHQRWRLDVVGSHLLMGVAMVGMLRPALAVGPATVWEVLFAAMTGWYGVRCVPILWGGRGNLPHDAVHAAMAVAMLLAVLWSGPGGMGSGVRGAEGAVVASLAALFAASAVATAARRRLVPGDVVHLGTAVAMAAMLVRML